jgi:hypothetical protein
VITGGRKRDIARSEILAVSRFKNQLEKKGARQLKRQQTGQRTMHQPMTKNEYQKKLGKGNQRRRQNRNTASFGEFVEEWIVSSVKRGLAKTVPNCE